MVRREEAERTSRDVREASSCTSPAGASPVSVSAGAPSSRSAVRAEMPEAEAGRQEPLRRKQQRGPQHEVKPAASTDLQRESRAAHVTAKAKFRTPQSGGTRERDLSGVWGAARVEGEVGNTRDPSARSLSRQGGSYKPKAKSSAVQRKSEGIVVARMGTKNNVTGAKGPCGERDEGEGKREGMIGRKSRSNHPDRRAVDKVLRLQTRLGEAAKRQPGRRFHALYDRIWRGDVLREAWKRVKRNKGASGVDAETIANIQQHGEDRFVEEIQNVLRAGTYRPATVLRRYIPKADGRKRPLGIPTVRDRVVQMATKLIHAVAYRRNAQRPLPAVSFQDVPAQNRRWPIRACSQHVLDLFHEAIFSVLLDVCDRLSIDSRCTLVPFHSLPRFPENVTSPDPVIQRVKTPSRLPLGRLP